MKLLEWHGLYNESWQGEIAPEAFSHPAKYSRGLIRQIYQFLLDEGLVKPGDTVADPFGGVALGALDAMRHGLHWHGCELEPRFHELGNQNIGLWNGRYRGWFDVWGTAVLHCGDSRQLPQVLGVGAGGVVSSPPYANSVNKESNGIDASKFSGRDKDRVFGGGNSNIETPMRYGSAPGQLGSMKAGDFDAAVSSPPYADTIEGGDGPGARWDAAGHPGAPDKVSSAAAYGRTPGQLGAMDAAVSSPPYVDAVKGGDSGIDLTKTKRDGDISHQKLGMITSSFAYGSTSGNIGNDTGDSFWLAARDIVAQTYAILKPGGVAAWVCGDFVRNGERVYFGRQWLALCEACGFEPYAWAVAWKTESRGVQLDIFGGEVHKRVDRVSFFRRLANERNPDAAILNEDVVIVRKPGAGG